MPRGFAKGLLRYACVGAGLQGEGHIKIIAALPNTELLAVCDVNEERAKAAAERYGAARALANYEEVLADPTVEAVSIALPDHLHREAAVKALQAGKHVLLEKPMATSVTDAQAIYDAQQASGKTLMVNQSNRWMSSFWSTHEMLEAGRFGDPMYVYARLNNTIYVPTKMLSWSANTRLPFWLITHRYDIARWYFGSEAKRVNAVSRSVVLKGMGIDTPDFYQATVEFENGCVGNFESCWIMPESLPHMVDSKFQLICSKGYVNVDAAQPVHMVADAESYQNRGFFSGDVDGEPRGFVFDAISHFVNCVLRGEEPLVDAHDGLMITKALTAMVESAEKGQPVDL
ncbi:Gfo/Idh/MocA family oxidoreductase [bacterium]|nr:Gfo/Idh/MocA family oxidoreductase [bacterium]